MKRLQYFTSTAVVALGLALAPSAFAAHGGGGGGAGHVAGFGGGHGFAGGFHGGARFAGGFHGDRFHDYRPIYRRGGTFFGYGTSYCSEYPNFYNPAVGCYGGPYPG